MRAKSFLLRSCVGLLLCMVVACGGSSPTEPSGGYTPGWGQLFVSESVVPSRTYNFDKPGTDKGRTRGNLAGDEEIDGSGGVNLLTGTFANRDFQFSVNRNGSTTNVTGFWVDDNTIRLTEGATSITLKRQ